MPRGSSNHGGIGILCKSQLNFCLNPLNISTVTFEHASILDPNNGVLYLVIYRSHPTQVNNFTVLKYMEEFEDFFERSFLVARQTCRGRWFQFSHKPEKSEVSNVITLISSFGLNNHVHFPTYISRNTLDLIITRFDEDLVRLYDADFRYGSDHYMIRIVLQQRKVPPLKVASKVRNFKNIDSASFKCDLEFELNNAGIDSNPTVNELVEILQNPSTKVLNSHAPVTNRSPVVHHKPV